MSVNMTNHNNNQIFLFYISLKKKFSIFKSDREFGEMKMQIEKFRIKYE